MIDNSNIIIVNDNNDISITKAVSDLARISDFLSELSPLLNKLADCQIRGFQLRQDITANIPTSFVNALGGNKTQPILDYIINATTNNNKKITMFISVQEPISPKKKKKSFFKILKDFFA